MKQRNIDEEVYKNNQCTSLCKVSDVRGLKLGTRQGFKTSSENANCLEKSLIMSLRFFHSFPFPPYL